MGSAGRTRGGGVWQGQEERAPCWKPWSAVGGTWGSGGSLTCPERPARAPCPPQTRAEPAPGSCKRPDGPEGRGRTARAQHREPPVVAVAGEAPRAAPASSPDALMGPRSCPPCPAASAQAAWRSVWAPRWGGQTKLLHLCPLTTVVSWPHMLPCRLLCDPHTSSLQTASHPLPGPPASTPPPRPGRPSRESRTSGGTESCPFLLFRGQRPKPSNRPPPWKQQQVRFPPQPWTSLSNCSVVPNATTSVLQPRQVQLLP